MTPPRHRLLPLPYLAGAVLFLALSVRTPALLGPGLIFLALAIRPLWQGRSR